MSTISFIDLQAQYQAYRDEIRQAIDDVLAHGRYILGPEVGAFEQELAEFVGVEHCITCANGTDSLMLALMALEIGPGDEVITPSFTFISTAEVIAFLGATPVFVDIDEQTYTVDPKAVDQAVTNRTKAIMPVSLFGQPSDMDAINAIAEPKGIAVIEDAAQSLGALYKGKRSCALSPIASTSFFPAKPLGCYGDGGALFCDDADLASKLRMLRVHGQERRYHHRYVGVNSRMDTIQAAILRVKLRHFADEIERRQAAANRYRELLAEKDLVLPYVREASMSVYAQYCIRVPDRERAIARLKEDNIPTAVYYPVPLHLQKCFSNVPVDRDALKVSERVANSIMALPMSAFITAEQQDRIARSL